MYGFQLNARIFAESRNKVPLVGPGMPIAEELRMDIPGSGNVRDISLSGALLSPFVMAAG